MLTKVTEFVGEGHYVRFQPVVNMPGFSYQVLVLDNNRKLVAKDRLSTGIRITERVALYFLQKHKQHQAV